MDIKEKREVKNDYMREYGKRPRGALYSRFRLMLRRCYDPNNHNYHQYGARGIKVCKEWRESFDVFFAWAMENGYESGLQIDRIDNEKGYSPENCHWVTSANNNRNRRNNKLDVEKVAEIRKLLAEGVSGPKIAKRFGVHHSLIYRIKANKQWI